MPWESIPAPGPPRNPQPAVRLTRRPAARPSGNLRGVSDKQRYRMRTPSTGREIIIEAEPDVVYRDRVTGEELQVLGKVLPLAPSKSKLPWSVENLRISPYTGQMVPKDLNDDPITGRRLPPLD